MTLMKTCSKCKVEKPFSDFNKGKDKYGLHIWCKQCYKQWAHEYYLKNKNAIDEQHRKYHRENREKILKKQREYSSRPEVKAHRQQYVKDNYEHIKDYHREYRKNNIEHIRERQRKYYHNNKDKHKIWQERYENKNRDKIRAKSREYAKNNRAKINEQRLEKSHSDPLFNFKERTRNMIRYAFRVKGHRKNSRTKDIVGCDLDDLWEYLLKTWEKNYGTKWNGEEYHIDHIIPLATAKTEEDVIRLCHYTNLQMLTPEDNMLKSDNL